MSKFSVASKLLARPSNRLTDNNSSDYGRNSSAGLLQPDEQEDNEENCLPASLALLLGYIMSKFPAASKPSAWLSNRLPDENSSDHTPIRPQVSCKWTKRRATWRIVALPPWHCCLTKLWASFQSPPSHWPSLPSDDFMSSGLRALYRSPLRGLPISPGLAMFSSLVHPLSRSLSRDSVRGNRFPRLCPQSQRSWRCLIRLARNGDSKSSPSDTTYWAPNHRMPHLSRCQWEMLLCWRRPCGVPWSPTSSIWGQWRLYSEFLATQARFPWSCGLRGDMKRIIFPLSPSAFRPGGSEAQSVVRSCLPTGGFICACHSWRSSTCRKGCVRILRITV